MSFRYYEEYLSPQGAPEMPEDKRGEEQINIISDSEEQGKCSFINLAVLSLTLIFCALIIFVLRENDYTSLNETNKLDKESFKSGEYFGSLEGDVVSHLSLRDEIIRTDNFLHYFCGVNNELIESEDDEELEAPDNAFRSAESPVPGGRNNDTDTHEVVTRVTTEATEKTTKKTKKKKKEEETSVTTAVKKMTSTEPEHTTTTTTTTEEETTTTPATKNTAPAITTKVTTAPTQAPETTTTTESTTKATTASTTESTTESTTQAETEPAEPAEE